MLNEQRHGPVGRIRALFGYIACLAVTIGAFWTAAATQQGFGEIEVSNVHYRTANGIPMRAKLFRPRTATGRTPAPGVVTVHGYQNNRETNDGFGIELARRGLVVLGIDAIGRGNSGRPLPPNDPEFDETFGVRNSVAHIKTLAYVDPERIGLLGHSMGAAYAYETALTDPSIEALVISGFVFDERATDTVPKNMLTIFGTIDEMRSRMTRSNDVKSEWMERTHVARILGNRSPVPGQTYGDFRAGSARRVVLPPITHLTAPHHRTAIAAAVDWMASALRPTTPHRIAPENQVWWIKEIATLLALVAGLLSTLPLCFILLAWRPFRRLARPVPPPVAIDRVTAPIAVNSLLLWLYIPLNAAVLLTNMYVVPLDHAFPMTLVNGIVGWLFLISIPGLLLLTRGLKSQRANGVSWTKRGVAPSNARQSLVSGDVMKSIILGMLLFVSVYVTTVILEKIFIVDLRFIFPGASDLTLDRALIYPRYFPFVLFSFLTMGIFLHVRLGRLPCHGWLRTWSRWSLFNTAVMVFPIVLHLAVQYVPLLLFGVIPLEGPSGAFASFTMNLFFIAGAFTLLVPISTGCFQMTGSPYVGATVTAAIFTWMLVSSQVIAPPPV